MPALQPDVSRNPRFCLSATQAEVYDEPTFLSGSLLGFLQVRRVSIGFTPVSGVKRFDLFNDYDSFAFWPLFLSLIRCFEPSAVLVGHEDQWIMRQKNMIAINQSLQVLDSLNVEMNATKFVLKMSRRDRFPRMVKNAQ